MLSHNYLKPLWPSLLVVLVVFPAVAIAAKPVELTIVHTSDLHGHVDEFTASGGWCALKTTPTEPCYGGFPRLAAFIKQTLATSPDAIILDAGDTVPGTLLFDSFGFPMMRAFLNRLPYDAMAVGNHELDAGLMGLRDYIALDGKDRLRVPMLAANLEIHADKRLRHSIAPYRIITRGGTPVGLIGLVSEETDMLTGKFGGYAIKPVRPALEKSIARLSARGVRHIVVLSHCGMAVDESLATVSGVDVIISAHTDTLLSNTLPGAEGPYPRVIRTGAQQALIVSTSDWGRYVGRIRVAFDNDGNTTRWSGDTVEMDATRPRDPAMESLVETYRSRWEREFKNQPIGTLVEPMEGDNKVCRFRECNTGNLLADAIFDNLSHDGPIDVVLLLGGGIRRAQAAGGITASAILEIIPFQDSIGVYSITGDALLKTLEHGVSRAESQTNDGTGRFLQVSGIRMTWDKTRPVGHRVVSASTTKNQNEIPIDPAKNYRVGFSTWAAAGGDGYTTFEPFLKTVKDSGASASNHLIRYLQRVSVVTPRVSGRIIEVKK